MNELEIRELRKHLPIWVARNSNELAEMLIARERAVQLLPHISYELELNEKVFSLLYGLSSVSTHLHLYAPLTLDITSQLHRLRLYCHSTHLVEASYASFAEFHNVAFVSTIPTQSHIGNQWDDVERQGEGVRVTYPETGDNNYHLLFYRCGFEFLEYGVRILNTQPRLARVNAWEFDNCDFNGCGYGIWQDGANQWLIRRTNFQLCQVGMVVDGRLNHFEDAHFERSKTDIIITPQSFTTYGTSDARRVSDEGRNTQLTTLPLRPNHLDT